MKESDPKTTKKMTNLLKNKNGSTVLPHLMDLSPGPQKFRPLDSASIIGDTKVTGGRYILRKTRKKWAKIIPEKKLFNMLAKGEISFGEAWVQMNKNPKRTTHMGEFYIKDDGTVLGRSAYVRLSRNDYDNKDLGYAMVSNKLHGKPFVKIDEIPQDRVQRLAYPMEVIEVVDKDLYDELRSKRE